KADYDYKTTVGTVLSVARRAKAIFDGSELHEKQQFINFLVPTPQLKEKELVFELRKPFNYVLDLSDLQSKTISIATERATWLRILDGFRTVNLNEFMIFTENYAF